LINDFWDAAMFNRWVKAHTREHYLVWRSQHYRFTLSHPLASIKNVLLRYSYVYNLVRNAYRAWGEDGALHLELTDGARLQLVPSLVEDAASMGQPARREFQLVLQALVDLQTLARQQGASVLVVFQPAKEEVYLPLLNRPVADLSAPMRMALDARGIEYLDVTATFKQCAEAGERLFFEVDGHINTQGHRLMAREVLAHLSKNATVYTLPYAAAAPHSMQLQCTAP
jgi:hypothetical protein